MLDKTKKISEIFVDLPFPEWNNDEFLLPTTSTSGLCSDANLASLWRA